MSYDINILSMCNSNDFNVISEEDPYRGEYQLEWEKCSDGTFELVRTAPEKLTPEEWQPPPQPLPPTPAPPARPDYAGVLNEQKYRDALGEWADMPSVEFESYRCVEQDLDRQRDCFR